MARAIWNGNISFGLVLIPVGLHTGEQGGEELSFSLLDANDHSPVGYKHINKVTGEEVPKERRVKGYEVAKGEYVILDEDDFKRANVEKTETIDILGFVDRSEIPVMRYERPYYLVPEKKGAKAYALMMEALRDTDRVGVATLVLRQRQHVCALIPIEDILVCEILRHDEEVRRPPSIDLGDPKLSAAELEMATKLIEGMSTSFDGIEVKDTYREDLMKLIEERAAHPEKIPEPLPERDTKKRGEVVDIMALLKQSVDAHTSGSARSSAGAHAKRGRARASKANASEARARRPKRGGAKKKKSARG